MWKVLLDIGDCVKSIFSVSRHFCSRKPQLSRQITGPDIFSISYSTIRGDLLYVIKLKHSIYNLFKIIEKTLVRDHKNVNVRNDFVKGIIFIFTKNC